MRGREGSRRENCQARGDRRVTVGPSGIWP